MNIVLGYAISFWDLGYGDFVMKPDLETLCLILWLEGMAMLLVDLEWENGSLVVESPRGVFRRQLERFAERGWSVGVGIELEFLIFNDIYEEVWDRVYCGLRLVNLYNMDYLLAGIVRLEPLIRKI